MPPPRKFTPEDVSREDARSHLRSQILSPLEVLAQSVSTIAPCTTPTLTIPLVFALAGEGTWLVYTLVTLGIILLAFCIAEFARDSASPGSLYIYTHSTLPPAFAALAAWAILFAYSATAASVLGGFLSYEYLLLGPLGTHLPPFLSASLAMGAAFILAVRDIKLSTRVMLWIEVLSVSLIGVVIVVALARQGLTLDAHQLRLQGVSASGVRLGVVLAIFSFVGFESATTLGEEARNPQRTIPRAVLQSGILAGLFFLLCAYGEVLGFRNAPAGAASLGTSTAPLHLLSAQAGAPALGVMIDVGVLVSMFAATLSCVIAAARVLLLMAHHGLVHRALGSTDRDSQAPIAASCVAAAIAVVPVLVLAVRGAAGADIYGWMGTVAVYGFLTAYGLVALALPVHLRRVGRLTPLRIALSVGATAATLAAMVGTVFPIPPPPYRYLPYCYLVYLACGMGWYAISSTNRT